MDFLEQRNRDLENWNRNLNLDFLEYLKDLENYEWTIGRPSKELIDDLLQRFYSSYGPYEIERFETGKEGNTSRYRSYLENKRSFLNSIQHVHSMAKYRPRNNEYNGCGGCGGGCCSFILLVIFILCFGGGGVNSCSKRSQKPSVAPQIETDRPNRRGQRGAPAPGIEDRRDSRRSSGRRPAPEESFRETSPPPTIGWEETARENKGIEREAWDAAEQPQKAGNRMVLTYRGVEYPFRYCPAGTFMMGSPVNEVGRRDNETRHHVILSRGFWILETPVTQAMWECVISSSLQQQGAQNERLPQTHLSWDNCQEYVRKLNNFGVAPSGYRFNLPTEAQWEYACRAGTTTAFHFGRTLNLNRNEANCKGTYDGTNSQKRATSQPTDLQLTEVGSYPANAWGLYDMHGNVYEWCLDWFDDYPKEKVIDPVMESPSLNRVLRGGSFLSSSVVCRSAARSKNKPNPSSAHLSAIGLRLVLVRK